MSNNVKRVAWVTGGGSGIGEAGAEALAADGWTVVVSGRRKDALDAVVAKITKSGGKAEAIALDVSKADDANKAAEQILAKHGRIDLLVNSAGINVPKRSWADMELEGWDKLVDINLGIRILLGSSYYQDWAENGDGEVFVKEDPLGNPVDKRHPWNQTTIPKPQKRNFDDKYTWVMSPRWFDKRTGDHLALDTGGGPIARLWATALAGLVDRGYVKAPGDGTVRIRLPKTMTKPDVEYTWRIPKWSNALERNRARTYFQAYAAAVALYCVEKAMDDVRAGRTQTFRPFKVPDEAIGCGFHEAVRGVLSHHLVIRNKKIANYHPYPPTPWNASPRDSYGTLGPYEDAVQNTPIFEENGPDNFKGIDIMRAVRSFDPCLPCGVHMYLGDGKLLKQMHTPTALMGLAKK